jgi:hypothetical protein
VREFTDAEYAQHETDLAAEKKLATEKIKNDKALADRQEIILDRLGVTADEFKTLIG